MAGRISGVRLLSGSNGLTTIVWILVVQAKKGVQKVERVERDGTEVFPDRGLKKIGSDVSIPVSWVTCIQQSHFDSLSLPHHPVR